MKNLMLTKLNSKGIPILKNQLHIERAINRLYEYERTGYNPEDIIKLHETICSLQEHIKRFEQW